MTRTARAHGKVPVRGQLLCEVSPWKCRRGNDYLEHDHTDNSQSPSFRGSAFYLVFSFSRMIELKGICLPSDTER